MMLPSRECRRKQVGLVIVKWQTIIKIHAVQLIFVSLSTYRSLVVSEDRLSDPLWIFGTAGSMTIILIIAGISALQSPLPFLRFDSTTSPEEVRSYLNSFLFDDKYRAAEFFARNGQFELVREFLYAGLSPAEILRSIGRENDDSESCMFRRELEDCEAVYQVLVSSPEVSWRRPRDFRRYYMSSAVRHAASSFPETTVRQFDELLRAVPTVSSELL